MSPKTLIPYPPGAERWAEFGKTFETLHAKLITGASDDLAGAQSHVDTLLRQHEPGLRGRQAAFDGAKAALLAIASPMARSVAAELIEERFTAMFPPPDFSTLSADCMALILRFATAPSVAAMERVSRSVKEVSRTCIEVWDHRVGPREQVAGYENAEVLRQNFIDRQQVLQVGGVQHDNASLYLFRDASCAEPALAPRPYFAHPKGADPSMSAPVLRRDTAILLRPGDKIKVYKVLALPVDELSHASAYRLIHISVDATSDLGREVQQARIYQSREGASYYAIYDNMTMSAPPHPSESLEDAMSRQFKRFDGCLYEHRVAKDKVIAWRGKDGSVVLATLEREVSSLQVHELTDALRVKQRRYLAAKMSMQTALHDGASLTEVVSQWRERLRAADGKGYDSASPLAQSVADSGAKWTLRAISRGRTPDLDDEDRAELLDYMARYETGVKTE